MSKKRIFIYGDSNTHGADEEHAGRFDENTRWTGVCQNLLDMIVVKLGANDVGLPGEPPESIAENAARVLRRARDLMEAKYPGRPFKCALFAPLEITEDAMTGAFSFVFGDPALVEQSKQLLAAYEKKAAEEGWLYFDGNKFARCGKWDGIHLDAENHRKMGEAAAEWFKNNI